MQPHDSSRSRFRPHPQSPVPPPHAPGDATPALPGLAPALPFASSRIEIAAPALLIEARFRDVPLASRLLRADETRTFTIGAARGADAPANPAYLGASAASLEPGGHVLVEPAAGRLRVELDAGDGRRAADPHAGAGAAPRLRARRGAADAVARFVPARGVRRGGAGAVRRRAGGGGGGTALRRGLALDIWYHAGVGLALLALLLIVRAIPGDPRSLSLDDLGEITGWIDMVTIPLDRELARGRQTDRREQDAGRRRREGREGAAGKAGDKRAKPTDGRRAIEGNTPKDERDVAGEIRKNSILQFFDGPKLGALGAVIDDKPAMGDDAKTVIGALQGRSSRRLGSRRPGRDRDRQVRRRNGRAHARDRYAGHAGQIRPRRRTGQWTGPRLRHGCRRLAVAQPKAPDVIPGMRHVRGLARQGDHPPHRPPPPQRGEVLLRPGAREVSRSWTAAWSRSSPSRGRARCSRRWCRARRWVHRPWRCAWSARSGAGSSPRRTAGAWRSSRTRSSSPRREASGRPGGAAPHPAPAAPASPRGEARSD